MKKNKIIVVLAFLAAPLTNSFAQDISYEVSEAIEVLKGKSINRTPEDAIKTLFEATSAEDYAVAQNALAIAYMNGIGVERDSIMAIQCFRNAAENGYVNAYHNLGMLEKYAPYGKQDFKKSVQLFEKGAEQGSLMCSYDAGYMYYKGLGCVQSYERAVDYFSRGIESNNPSCLYMLGLCYRNGYGVECDEELAMSYLEKAGQANYRYAIEETLRENSEIEETVFIECDNNNVYVPENIPERFSMINNDKNLCGSYSGLLLTYDWSGSHLIKEENIRMTIAKENEEYRGAFIIGNDSVAFTSTSDSEGNLLFNNTKLFLSERYSGDNKIDFIVENATLASLCNTLSGNLNLYSVRHQEPQRPMYISLNKEFGGNTHNNPNECSLTAYPTNNNGSIDVCFLLPKDIKSATICIYTQNGLMGKNYTLGALTSGIHRFTLNPNLNSGNYCISLKADELKGQTIIMLK